MKNKVNAVLLIDDEKNPPTQEAFNRSIKKYFGDDFAEINEPAPSPSPYQYQSKN